MGYDKVAFIQNLGTGLSDLSTMDDKEVRFSENPDAATAEILARYNESTGELVKAVEYFEQAQKLNQNPDKDYYYDIFGVKNWGFGKKLFTFEDLKSSASLALKSANSNDKQKFEVLYYMTYLLKSYPDDQDLQEYLKQACNMLSADTSLASKKTKNTLDICTALFLKKDKEQAISLKQASMPEGWQNNPSLLNSYAWWCFENNVDLENAEKLARKGAELAEKDMDKAMILDTVAEIVNLQGDPNQAAEIMKEAIKLHPGRAAYQRQLERFQNLAAK